MTTAFPLSQSIGLLRDVLKRSPVAFLLGAGCPASVSIDGQPLIPAVKGLTEYVLSQLRIQHEALVNVIMARLIASGVASPNIENILSYIRTLSAVIVDGDVNGVTREALDTLEAEACALIKSVASAPLPNGDTSYHRLAAWALGACGQIGVEFFTTNYDLLLEQALEFFKVPYFDGFVGAAEPFFDLAAIENDRLPDRWAKLWKLHGSINWYLKNRQAIRATTVGDNSSLLIYPSHLKYDESRRLPYVAMADRLLSFLRKERAVLISVGFSFSDEHLNDLLASGLRANGSASLFALMRDSFDSGSPLHRFAESNPSVSVYWPDAAMIGGLRGSWYANDFSRDAPRSSLVRWDVDNGQFSGGDFTVFSEFLGEMVNYDRFNKESATAAPIPLEMPSTEPQDTGAANVDHSPGT